jgi:competence protein ComEC
MPGGVRRHAAAPARLRAAPHAVLVAFCAGLCAPLAGVGSPAAGLVACLAAAAGAGVAGAAGRAGPAVVLLLVAAAAAGVGWGAARYAATAQAPLEVPVRVAGTVVVDAPARPDGFGGLRARARVDDLRTASGRRLPGRLRLLLDLPAGPGAPRLGERLRVAGWVRSPARATSPGWWRAWLERQGIAGRLRPEATAPAGRRGGLAGARDRWRTWASEHAGAGLSGDRAALVRGMALGGGDDLSEESAAAFRDAGLWHLLAVSGQNVTVVALAALALLRALGARRRAAVGGAALTMAAYCLACDGGASVARAGVVGGLGLLAELRSAPRERWYLLLAGLAALLAHNPRAIGDPGLQLSFAAVAGLFLLAPPLEGWLRGWLPARVAGLAAMAAAAGLATAPVTVAHFGRLSLVGLALNVVAVPLAAPVVILALLGMAAGALVPAAGAALAWLAGAGAWLLLTSARWASSPPGAAVDLPGWAAPLAAALPAAVVAAAAWLRPGGPPAWARRPRTWRAGAAAVALLAAAGWALGRPPAPAPWPAGPAVTALDVGQGDAILLRGPDGSAALFDTGPPGAEGGGGAAPVVAALRRMGVRRLDAIVLTHDSLDHVGGARDVLGRMPVGAVLSPVPPQDGWLPWARAALDEARRRGVPTGELRAGAQLRVGPWRVRVLSPARARPAGADPNPWSLVAVASAGPLDVLLTADAESDALAGLPAGRVEVLKVSHHGSEDPGLPRELARLRPRVALISAGEGNAFRHPRPETLAALAAAGTTAWRTDRSGDVTAVLDGAGAGVGVAGTR